MQRFCNISLKFDSNIYKKKVYYIHKYFVDYSTKKNLTENMLSYIILKYYSEHSLKKKFHIRTLKLSRNSLEDRSNVSVIL